MTWSKLCANWIMNEFRATGVPLDEMAIVWPAPELAVLLRAMHEGRITRAVARKTFLARIALDQKSGEVRDFSPRSSMQCVGAADMEVNRRPSPAARPSPSPA